ncbi:hypothetical protein GBA63_01095 [Rubrobacter tropicus]|uniref:Uncharacterized protein n=1 Tax=Rubrobacter tropicus TaxID=2653851 RepID=A0A6G8Q4F3_9ACTN|nr:hypothetical protein GBA63_01095 [Rubrobacter tropicus]
MSLPTRPSSTSEFWPPIRVSLPQLPLSLSELFPPLRVSLPPIPITKSLPSNAFILLSAFVPINLSSWFVPVMVEPSPASAAPTPSARSITPISNIRPILRSIVVASLSLVYGYILDT